HDEMVVALGCPRYPGNRDALRFSHSQLSFLSPEKTKPFRLLQTEGPLAGPRVHGLSCAGARWLSPPGDQALARRAAPQGALSIRLGPAVRDPSGREIVAGGREVVNALGSPRPQRLKVLRPLD